MMYKWMNEWLVWKKIYIFLFKVIHLVDEKVCSFVWWEMYVGWWWMVGRIAVAFLLGIDETWKAVMLMLSWWRSADDDVKNLNVCEVYLFGKKTIYNNNNYKKIHSELKLFDFKILFFFFEIYFKCSSLISPISNKNPKKT